MGDIFHGWRRKVGCVTLVMACALMGMWGRSLLIGESLRLPSDQLTDAFIASDDDGLIGFYFRRIDDGQYHFRGKRWYTRNKIKEQYRSDFFTQLDRIDWLWDVGGFYIGQSHSSTYTQGIAIVPYWSLVVPLTLLSAYLILWKPRKTPAKPVVDGNG